MRCRRSPDTHPLRCGHRRREGVDRQVSVVRSKPSPVVSLSLNRAGTACRAPTTITRRDTPPVVTRALNRADTGGLPLQIQSFRLSHNKR